MDVIWSDVGDPAAFACAVLAREAPDINPEAIRRSAWAVETLPLRGIMLAPGMVEEHDADPVHVDRRDRFITAITEGRPIPPLIVVGTEPVRAPSGAIRYLILPYPEVGGVPLLADGYARYRALTRLGLKEAVVVRQQRP